MHSENDTCFSVSSLHHHLILSASEDQTLRLWSSSAQDAIGLEMTLDFGLGRLWTMKVDEEKYLVATGGDNGFVVFRVNKLEK